MNPNTKILNLSNAYLKPLKNQHCFPTQALNYHCQHKIQHCKLHNKQTHQRVKHRVCLIANSLLLMLAWALMVAYQSWALVVSQYQLHTSLVFHQYIVHPSPSQEGRHLNELNHRQELCWIRVGRRVRGYRMIQSVCTHVICHTQIEDKIVLTFTTPSRWKDITHLC